MPPTDWLTRSTPPQPPPEHATPAAGAARSYPLEPAPAGARALLAMLRYRAGYVAAGLVLGVASATYFASRDQPVYRATAVVQLADVRGTVVRGLEAEAPAWASRSSDPLLSKLQLLKSRGLVGRVVDEHGLRLRLSASKIPGLQLAAASTDRAAPADTLRLAFGDSNVSVSNRAGARGVAPYGKPIVVGGVRLAVAAHPGVQSGSLAMLPREATIDSVLAGLRVSPRADTDVIDVSYLGPQPAVAQGVVNRLSELFAEMDVQAAQEQSRRRRVFLEGQLRETDAALASAQQALDSYRRGQPAYSSREQMAAQQNALVALDIRREEIDADRRMSQALLERLERYQGGAGAEEFHALVSSPDVSGNPVVAQLLQRLVQYQTERDSLTTGEWRSAAASPEVVRLTELITATQAQVVGAVRSQILGLEARIASLTDLRNRMAASAVLPSEESKETRLAEQVAASRAIADDIRQEYQKARMSEAAAIGQVQVLDLAALPEHPAKSLRSMKLGLGLLLGLLAGVGGATLREAADGSVRRREEVESHMQLPVLAVIPRITTAGRLVTLGRAALPASTGADPAVTQPAPIRNLRALASRWTAPREERNQAAAREAQRMLRNNLAWAAGTTNGPTIIVVTSAAAGEGKTTTAVNLALGYVREGKSTILLDCDLRRPRLHDYFHIAQSPGLGQLLLGHADLPSVVRASHVPGLSVVPAGHLAVDAFDGVNVDRFRHTLHQLAGRYERVVIDTPPVLAVADAAMLASLGDGVVVVVRAGETDRVAVEQSLRQLAFVGARIMGVVLNDAGGELERYGRYSPVRAYGVGEA